MSLEYKNYKADLSVRGEEFVGVVSNIFPDRLEFSGKTVTEVVAAFKAAVDSFQERLKRTS